MTDGVLPNPSTNMQVSAGTGMNVLVEPGFAICSGGMKLEESQRTLAIQAADVNYDRIDTVVLRWNDNDSERICDFYIVPGTPASSPIRPVLTRTESIWEIGLADLFITKNSTEISNQRITDTRHETERCGVISAISEFDTTSIYQQVQADLADFKAEEQTEFLAWFENVRNMLSEDAAGNLQLQIDEINEKLSGEVVFAEDIVNDAVTEDTQKPVSAAVAKDLQDQITSLGKSVSDGKAKVATAITEEGVNTATTAEYDTMAANVHTVADNHYAAGVVDADNRANANSTNYKTGYNAGVANADARVNTASASYKQGYNAGVTGGREGYVPKSAITLWFFGDQTDAGCSRAETIQAAVPSGYTTVTISGTLPPAGTSAVYTVTARVAGTETWHTFSSSASNTISGTFNVSGYDVIRVSRSGHAKTGNYNVSITFN